MESKQQSFSIWEVETEEKCCLKIEKAVLTNQQMHELKLNFLPYAKFLGIVFLNEPEKNIDPYIDYKVGLRLTNFLLEKSKFLTKLRVFRLEIDRPDLFSDNALNSLKQLLIEKEEETLELELILHKNTSLTMAALESLLTDIMMRKRLIRLSLILPKNNKLVDSFLVGRIDPLRASLSSLNVELPEAYLLGDKFMQSIIYLLKVNENLSDLKIIFPSITKISFEMNETFLKTLAGLKHLRGLDLNFDRAILSEKNGLKSLWSSLKTKKDLISLKLSLFRLNSVSGEDIATLSILLKVSLTQLTELSLNYSMLIITKENQISELLKVLSEKNNLRLLSLDSLRINEISDNILIRLAHILDSNKDLTNFKFRANNLGEMSSKVTNKGLLWLSNKLFNRKAPILSFVLEVPILPALGLELAFLAIKAEKGQKITSLKIGTLIKSSNKEFETLIKWVYSRVKSRLLKLQKLWAIQNNALFKKIKIRSEVKRSIEIFCV